MRGSSEKKKNLIIIAIEAVVLIIAAVCSLVMYKFQKGMVVDPTTSYSSYAVFDDGVWSVDTSAVEAGSFITALETGALDLKFGSYKALIEYDTDTLQTMGMKSGGGSFRHTFSQMSPNSNLMESRFEIYTNSITNLQMEFHCWGGSHFDIGSITIYPTFSMYMRLLTELIALFLIADILYMCRKASWYKHFIRVSAMALLVTVPFLVDGVHLGHDYLFHLVRIEGIADGLRAGEFPVKMQPIWSDGYGLPVSVFYGDALLYIPAILRILGFFVTPAYLIFIFAVNLITSAVSYFSFGRIFKNERMGMILTAVYLSANYRLMDIYIRAAVGEYCAMAFLPLVALGMYGIFCDDIKDKRYYRNAIYLALGMTGIVESHLLSTEMIVIVLVLICLALIKRTIRKETITAFALAVGVFILLNLAFLVPFLDYYINVPVGINTGAGASGPIGSSAAFIAQYFQFFRDVFGDDSALIGDRMPLTPGPILMIAFVAGWVIWAKRRENKKLLMYLITGMALLFVSSNLFPWNVVARLGTIGTVLTTIQFPWRYLSIAVVMLTLVLGEILSTSAEGQPTSFNHATGTVILIASMVVTGIFAGSYAEGADLRYYVDRNGFMDHAVASWEYSLVREDDEPQTYEVTAEGVELTSDLTRSGCNASIDLDAGENGGWVEFPISAYKGYKAATGGGEKLDITKGDAGRIRVSIPAGYNGPVNIDFIQPVSWRIAELISAAAWIALIVCLSRQRRKDR